MIKSHKDRNQNGFVAFFSVTFDVRVSKSKKKDENYRYEDTFKLRTKTTSKEKKEIWQMCLIPCAYLTATSYNIKW